MAQTVYDYTGLLSGRSWWTGAFSKKPVFLTYSFEASSYDYLTEKGFSKAYANSFKPFTAVEKAAARDALNQWDSASGITFLEAPAGQGDVRFGNYDLALNPAAAKSTAYAYYPATVISSDLDIYYSEDFSGDVYVSTAAMGSAAGDMTHLLAHEIGHAIGFKHPFEGNRVLAPSYDNSDYTVMSYTGLSPKLGPFDVQAAQSLYGTDAEDGHQVSRWSWNAKTATLSQIGSGHNDTIRGVAAADVIRGMGGKDILFGSGGNDTIDGGSSVDIIHGGDGADRASGGSGNDQVHGDDGDDTLSGDANSDILRGGNGADALAGGDGRDELYGGLGSDTLVGGAGDDRLYGGDHNRANDNGPDTADYSTAKKPITVLMDGIPDPHVPFFRYQAAGVEIGHDHFYDIENVIGGAAADVITGSGRPNVLKGGAGSDVIGGGNGADTLYGGLGLDELTGGKDADRFVFDTKLGGSNVKTVTDFTAHSDTLVFDHDLFKGLKIGKLSSSEFHVGKAAHDSNDHVVYDKTTGALFYDSDGIGGHGQFKVAMLDPGLTLHGSDFLIIA